MELQSVFSDQGRHTFDEDAVDLRAGMTIRIPAGVRHHLTNTGTEVLVCLIAFSSGERQTVFLRRRHGTL